MSGFVMKLVNVKLWELRRRIWLKGARTLMSYLNGIKRYMNRPLLPRHGARYLQMAPSLGRPGLGD